MLGCTMLNKALCTLASHCQIHTSQANWSRQAPWWVAPPWTCFLGSDLYQMRPSTTLNSTLTTTMRAVHSPPSQQHVNPPEARVPWGPLSPPLAPRQCDSSSYSRHFSGPLLPLPPGLIAADISERQQVCPAESRDMLESVKPSSLMIAGNVRARGIGQH